MSAGCGSDGAGRKEIRVASLRVGQPLPSDLTDASGVLLLRAGVVITQGFIDTLTRRGVRSVTTRETESARREREAREVATETDGRQDKRCGTAEPKRAPRAGASGDGTSGGGASGGGASGGGASGGGASGGGASGAVAEDASGELSYTPSGVGPRLSLGELREMTVRAERAFDAGLERYFELGPAFLAGRHRDLGPAEELVRGFARYAAADPALVLALLRLRGSAEGRLYRHAMKSALLSMTLTQQMGFDEDRTADAGVAALVHDLGMLRVPASVRDAPRRLRPDEWRLIHEHPTHTLNLLDKMSGVGDSVKTAAYQVHERCDASGYPRQRPRPFIHPLAKVIAVADTYAAMTDGRPHRGPVCGHEAIKAVLREVQVGKLDRGVARALLDTMSMFPVGSHVGLSDGRAARVLRGVPGQPVKPVVVVLNNGEPADWELDLAQVGDLSITRVLPDEAAAAA
ncbi:MAG: HD domain-containing phosphohydrolase [Planctomycetota bacterium]